MLLGSDAAKSEITSKAVRVIRNDVELPNALGAYRLSKSWPRIPKPTATRHYS
jgi:hypothetical protein